MVVLLHVQRGFRRCFLLLVPFVLAGGCQTTPSADQEGRATQRAEVWAAFEAYAAGDGVPLEPAAYGIRFSDVPRAAETAARATEMAVVSIDHGQDRFVIKLLTLDSQTASIVVDRVAPPEILRATVAVGVFSNAAAAKHLSDEFFEALQTWGAVKRFSE
jgi:hypothetical protein